MSIANEEETAMDRNRVEEILRDSGVLLTGHFILTSGKHSGQYMQCAQILKYPAYAEELAKGLAEEFSGENADIVIGPATGGIIIAYELARQLKCNNLFAERENGEMTLRRGFSIPKGARVIVAEDVITTGGSVKEVMALVEAAEATVVGVAVLVDRSMGKADFGVKTRAAYTAEIEAYEPDNCPICKEGKSTAVKPGSRGL